MMIKKGDSIPDGALWEFERKEGGGAPKEFSITQLCAKKKIALFGLPGAFTPTCSANHLPGFVKHADEMLNYVDEIWCVAVNDAFVMDAWGGQQKAVGKIRMFADGSGSMTNTLGLNLDLTHRGMGIRMRRFSMLLINGVVENINIEETGKFEVSSAEIMLDQAKKI